MSIQPTTSGSFIKASIDLEGPLPGSKRHFRSGSSTSGPKLQSPYQDGQIISYPCKDFQIYFYFCLFVELQHNVTEQLPLFNALRRFLRLAPLAGAKNFFFDIVSYIFGKPIQFPIKCRAPVICSLENRGKKCA